LATKIQRLIGSNCVPIGRFLFVRLA